MDKEKKIAVGLDIGTTTVSGIVINPSDGKVLDIYNVENDSQIVSEHPWEHIQSPERIWEIVTGLLEDILTKYSVDSIGLTGQMHGILCCSKEGKVLSPLYTWQDRRAEANSNACNEILRLTGSLVPAGYGLATLYHLIQQKEVPQEPYYVCTIMDFIAVRLSGLKRPVMHISNAASWGLYSHTAKDFDDIALHKLGISRDILPVVIGENRVVGMYQNIPVSVSLGDNQAAFMGAVQEPLHTVLLNVGTGSQVSLLSEELLTETSLVEARPFDKKRVLYSGSALCGGRAYAMLEKLFRSYAVACGLPDEPRYDVLNAFAKEGVETVTVAQVCTTFAGTRENAEIKGSMTGLDEQHFTAPALSAGVLYGMVKELYEMYLKMPHSHINTLVASGNGVRKNPVLQQVIEDVFGLAVELPEHTEEAAFGAAKFGAKATLE